MSVGGAELMVLLKARDDTARAMKGFQSNLNSVAKTARQAGAVVTAFGAAGALALKSFISSAKDQQIGIRQLDQSLKNLGFSYAGVGGEIETVIESLQRKTNFGDEPQRDALRTLISIGGDYQAALEALPAVLDLAADRNMKLNAAALLVGKALAGETSSLSRYGILLEKGATQTETMAAITRQFAGAAEAAQNPLTQMRNRMGDVGQIIGDALLPFVDKAAVLIEMLARNLQAMNPTVLKTLAIIGGLATAFALVAGPALLMIGFLPAIISGFGALVKVVKGMQIAFAVLNATMAANPFMLVVIAIAALVAIGIAVWKNWDFIKEKAAQLWNFLVPTFEKGINFLIKIFNVWTKVYREGLAKLLEAAQKVAGFFGQELPQGVQTAIDALREGVPEVQLARASIQEMGEAVEETAKSAGMLASPLRDAGQAAAETAGEVAKVAKEVKEFGRELTEAERGLIELQGHLGLTELATIKNTAAWEKDRKAVEDATRAYREETDAAIKATEAKKEMESKLRALLAMLSPTSAAVRALTNENIQLEQRVRLAQVALEAQTETAKENQRIQQDHQAVVARLSQEWRDYQFELSATGQALEVLGNDHMAVLKAVSDVTGFSIKQINDHLTDMGISFKDAQKIVEIFGPAVAAEIRRVADESKEATGEVKAMLEEIARLRDLARNPHGPTARGERADELGRLGEIKNRIRILQNANVHDRNRLGREAAGSAFPERVRQDFADREAERNAMVQQLIEERRALQGLAHGGVIARAGFAMVGERGPELVRALPGGGAQVFSNQQSSAMVGGRGRELVIVVELDGEVIGRSRRIHESEVERIRVKTGFRS